MGDERTYEHPVALRAVTSTDAMTADWAHLPYDFMAKVSNEIINKVKGVNRVCYDISSKPPSTIEWEWLLLWPEICLRPNNNLYIDRANESSKLHWHGHFIKVFRLVAFIMKLLLSGKTFVWKNFDVICPIIVDFDTYK